MLRISTLVFALLFTVVASANINPQNQKPQESTPSNVVNFRHNCANAVTQIDQQVNNVRARLTTGGDVWWDGSQGRYVVPKPPPGVPEVSSIFAAAVWIGGVDPGNNLKVAAQQFGRGSGFFDFYPGPLIDEGASFGSTEAEICAKWDKFFVVKGENIDQHVKKWRLAVANGETFLNPEEIPEDVLGWPARGNRFFEGIHQFQLPTANQGLAGFWDQAGDGLYQPDEGDYPMIEIRRCNGFEPRSAPDEMIFWVYNDAGNDHKESGTERQIGMEIQVQAFAYKTNDDINNMTFQRYKLINRAVERLDSTYFGIWVDPDLGCHLDDYVGCDVDRSLAYVYNIDQVDGSSGCDCGEVSTYCDEVPILGVDYFQGPQDEFGNELGMSSFTYFNNAGAPPDPHPATTDPSTALEYYYYLSGRWRDGSPVTYGGNGYMTGDPYPYAFPGAPNDPNDWSMLFGKHAVRRPSHNSGFRAIYFTSGCAK